MTPSQLDFGPRDAAEHLRVLSNRLAKENSIAFGVAWDRVRTAQPALWRLAHGQAVHETVLPAFNSFHILNRLAADAPGTGFAGAWQAFCDAYPERVYAATASTPADYSKRGPGAAGAQIFNRAPAGIDAGEWANALAKAPQVIAAIERASSQSSAVDRGYGLWRDEVHGLEGDFKKALRVLQQQRGWTLQQAFDHLQKTEPVFWGRFVSNYRL